MNYNIFSSILQNFLGQLPVMIVAAVACIVTLLNWQQSPSASIFSLLGFGIALLLCLVVPISQGLLQGWVLQNPSSAANLRFIFMGLNILWSVLKAASYVLLLPAIYTGRSVRPTGPPQI